MTIQTIAISSGRRGHAEMCLLCFPILILGYYKVVQLMIIWVQILISLEKWVLRHMID